VTVGVLDGDADRLAAEGKPAGNADDEVPILILIDLSLERVPGELV
jgi:hypothetical protein